MQIKPQVVQPLNYATASGFVNMGDAGGSYASWREPIYPESPNGTAMQQLRFRNHVSIMTAAEVLGIRPAEVSGLERGAYELTDAEWQHVFNVLAKPKA